MRRPTPLSPRGPNRKRKPLDLSKAVLPSNYLPKNLTMKALALKADVCRATLGKVFSGRRRTSAYTMYRIGLALGVSMDLWLPACFLARRAGLRRNYIRYWTLRNAREAEQAKQAEQAEPVTTVDERAERQRLKDEGFLP